MYMYVYELDILWLPSMYMIMHDGSIRVDHDASLFDHELLKVAVGDLPQHRQAKREMTSDVNFQPTPPKRPRTGIFQPEGTV